MREQHRWTVAELDKAKDLRRRGYSSSEIGRDLKRTPNSVVGALYRAGEPAVLNLPRPRAEEVASVPRNRPIPMRFADAS